MTVELHARERRPASGRPGEGDPAPVADWRGFHVALRHAALDATQNGAPLSLLMLEPVGPARPRQPSGADPAVRDRLAGTIAAGLGAGCILAFYAEQRIAIIMMDTDLGTALSRAERIGHSVSSDGCDGSTCGIGVAQFRDDESLGQLIERAVEALERARSAQSLIAVARERVRRPRRSLPGLCEQPCVCGLHAAPGLCGLT
jgi:hypothetical protein